MKKNVKEEKKVNPVVNFFNKPTPIFIAMILIIIGLIIYIGRYNSRIKIYKGTISNDEIGISSIHYFINGDVNYFYSSGCVFGGENKDVYDYQIGFYVVDDENNYYEFLVRKGSLETPTDLKTITSELSSWDISETNNSKYQFTDKVRKNINNLHFVIRGTSKSGLNEYDINIDYKIDMNKITK